MRKRHVYAKRIIEFSTFFAFLIYISVYTYIKKIPPRGSGQLSIQTIF